MANASSTPWITVSDWQASQWEDQFDTDAIDFAPVVVVHAPRVAWDHDDELPSYVEDIARAIVGDLMDEEHPHEWECLDTWQPFRVRDGGIVVVIGEGR